MKRIVNLLHKDLSYKIQGIAFEIRKDFGLGHKEQIYQKAFEEELKNKKISYEREKAIKIYSPKDGKFIGLYRPDFIIDKKIIVEIKTFKFVPKDEMRKIYDYLRNSEYELGYLINFASPRLYIKRVIFTNNKKNWFKKLLVSVSLVFVSLLLVLFSGLSSAANGATLYLEPASGQYQPGDTFLIDVKIDTEGECINTVEANLSYDKDILKAVDFSRGESILSLWVKEPTFSVVLCGEANVSCGLVQFSGGIPGGYCGRISGDPGQSNSLGKIIFKIPSLIISQIPKNQGEIKFLETSKVLLNDGLGTPAKLSVRGATFEILSKGEPAKEEWKEELAEDNIPPEPFEIKPQRDPLIFEGKYFIIFSTADKQTGLDHYEVKETRNRHETEHEKTLNWKKAESPYLLEDQELKSIIKIRAIDKAGNERIAEYTPLKITKEITKKALKIFIIFIIICLVIIGWIIKRWRKTH